MTYAAPHADCYDDGLVHSHDWSTTATPPGCHHKEGRRTQAASRTGHEHDDGLVHNHHWARS